MFVDQFRFSGVKEFALSSHVFLTVMLTIVSIDGWPLRVTEHPNLPAGSPTSWMEILGWEVVPNSPKTEQWPEALISDKHILVKLFGSKFESRPIAHRFFIFGTIMSLLRITLAGLDLRFLQTDPSR